MPTKRLGMRAPNYRNFLPTPLRRDSISGAKDATKLSSTAHKTRQISSSSHVIRPAETAVPGFRLREVSNEVLEQLPKRRGDHLPVQNVGAI